MQFTFSYAQPSAITNSLHETRMAFAPDLLRQPTYFRGKLRQSVAFREAISALHDVVVSDLRFKKTDKSAYKAWLAEEEQRLLAQATARRGDLVARMADLQKELNELFRRYDARLKPYREAERRFWDFQYRHNPAFVRAFDPVITVHPDQLFFECFSVDESTYGRLAAKYDVFERIIEFECGTTNVDYSAALYGEMQKVRSYRETFFEVDPSGFTVQTEGEDTHREKKIDLPDSWVRGFLQVQSAMSLPMTTFVLTPLDLYNVCLFLRRHKERESPRALRWELKRGERIKAVMEPWEAAIEMSAVWEGDEPRIIRTWGRRRLLTLERLIPVAQCITVHLLGRGLPHFYVVDVGDLIYTLGLSGWTANDWAGSANFDLMTSRAKLNALQLASLLKVLKEKKFATFDELARATQLSRADVSGGLNLWCQSGKVIYDLSDNLYRYRDMTREDLPVEDLRFRNEREAAASKLVEDGNASVTSSRTVPKRGVEISGAVKDGKNTRRPTLFLDVDGRITQAECDCYWHKSNKLQQGPCEHILAVRLVFERQ